MNWLAAGWGVVKGIFNGGKKIAGKTVDYGVKGIKWLWKNTPKGINKALDMMSDPAKYLKKLSQLLLFALGAMGLYNTVKMQNAGNKEADLKDKVQNMNDKKIAKEVNKGAKDRKQEIKKVQEQEKLAIAADGINNSAEKTGDTVKNVLGNLIVTIPSSEKGQKEEKDEKQIVNMDPDQQLAMLVGNLIGAEEENQVQIE